MRLERGEAIDVVIMAAPALDDLIKQGKVRADSRVDLVQSKIGMAVKAGAPKPDISTVDALKRTLLAAKSIAYSDSASGVYLSTELFPKLGIADQIKGKMPEDRGRPRRRSRREGRGRDRLPADQRAASREGHRHRRSAAARRAEGHRVRRGHPGNVKASGGGQGAHPVARVAGRLRGHQEECSGARPFEITSRQPGRKFLAIVPGSSRANCPAEPLTPQPAAASCDRLSRRRIAGQCPRP